MQIRTPLGLAVALAFSLPALGLAPAAQAARPATGFWAASASPSHTTVHSSQARSTCRKERVAWSGENVLMLLAKTRRAQAVALRRTVTARGALVKCESALRSPAPTPPAPAPAVTTPPAGGTPEPAPAPAAPTAGVEQPGVVVVPPVVPTEASVTVNGSGGGSTVSASAAVTLVGDALTPAPAGTLYTLSLRTALKGPRPLGCQRGEDSPAFTTAVGTLTVVPSNAAPLCPGAAQGTLWSGPPDAVLGDEDAVNIAKVEFTVVAP
jgi:hypothetical protein